MTDKSFYDPSGKIEHGGSVFCTVLKKQPGGYAVEFGRNGMRGMLLTQEKFPPQSKLMVQFEGFQSGLAVFYLPREGAAICAPDQQGHSGGYSHQFDSGSYEPDLRSGGYTHQYDSGGYAQQYNAAGYAEQQRSCRYHQQYQSGGYAQQYQSGGYAQQYQSGGYAQQEQSGGYAQQEQSGGYSAQEQSGGYPAQEQSDGYPAQEQSGGYSRRSAGSAARGEAEDCSPQQNVGAYKKSRKSSELRSTGAIRQPREIGVYRRPRPRAFSSDERQTRNCNLPYDDSAEPYDEYIHDYSAPPAMARNRFANLRPEEEGLVQSFFNSLRQALWPRSY